MTQVGYALDTLVAPLFNADVPRPAPARRVSGTLVVIGNGMVGHRLCRRLVERGATAHHRVVVFGEECVPAYDRVHLTGLFEGGDERDLLLAPEDWYEQHGIELRLGDPVIEIDRQARLVRSASGAVIGYDRLVLATGSAPFVPPIEGATLPGVYSYRALNDLRAIREAARTARAAAVIGGGLLGLEAARALHRLGLHVTVVEAAAGLMPAQLDQEAGEELQRQVEASGIEVLTGAITRRIVPNGRRRRLELAGGDSRTVDLVVITAGVRPRSELAAACELALAPNGGIVVNEQLQTSDPHIFALGECACHEGRTWGLVAPGFEMADTLAAAIAGQPAAYRATPPTVRLKLLDVEVASAGEPLEPGDAIRYRADGVCRVVRIHRGRIVAALGVGEWSDFPLVQQATAERKRIWAWQRARFVRTGRLWRTTTAPSALTLSAEATVCHCLKVTRGQIASACEAGCTTAEAIADRTGASTLCGSCRPLLTQLVGGTAWTPTRPAYGLLAASTLALAAALAVFALSPIPFSTSVQDSFRVDGLWRNGVWRQATGFALIGSSLAASLLSVRKRWRRASGAGPYTAWRMVHAIVGMLTVAMLAVHTGGRLGDNLNLALILSFGALNVAGSLAGVATSLGSRLQSPRWRAALVAAHIIAIWPLPVLVAFHVLAVYYF